MDRFTSKCRKGNTPEECTEWIAGKYPSGYGKFSYEGKADYAHRVAYRLFKGEIPDGMVVMHICDNPSCVNVDHLRLGTMADNIADRDKKGRHRPHGRKPRSEEEKNIVKEMYATGDYTQEQIAEIIGTYQPVISKILNAP